MKKLVFSLLLLAAPAYSSEMMRHCEDYDIYWNKYNNYISITDSKGIVFPVNEYYINSNYVIMTRTDGNAKHRWEYNRLTKILKHHYYLNWLDSTPTYSYDYVCSPYTPLD